MTLPNQVPTIVIAEELAAVVGALVEASVQARPTDTAPEPGYVATISAAEAGRGAMQVYFDRAGAATLAGRTTASGVHPDEAAIVASLREIAGQAATSTAMRAGRGLRLEASPVEKVVEAASWSSPSLFELAAGNQILCRIAVTGAIELADASAGATVSPAAGHPSLDVILDIDLPLVVQLGRTEMSLKDLTALGPGSLIDLGRSPDDAVDLLVSNQVVAKGEVVVVGGHYGIRVRDIVSTADRIRSMEAELR